MTGKEMEEKMSFAELLENTPRSPGYWVSPGDTVSGVVVKINQDTIFIDLGGKSEGIAEKEEFLDKEGNLTLKEGDPVKLKVSSVRNGIHLSRSIRAHGAEALEMLREAQQNQIPVEGRVAAVNAGGLEVDLSGIRGFCPMGQIDLRFCKNPEEHIGARYHFRIMEIDEKRKNIILSRRMLLQEEQEKLAQETLSSLKEGLQVEGIVTKLADFGAFVDIGGIEGMVHVSEISHSRIPHPSEVLKTGQRIQAKILKIEPDKGNRLRIALSIRALELEPWERGLEFKEGDVICGKVSRLADFGAFVEVAPGVDGLLHLSEISYERISHPNKVLKEGDSIEVLVLKIDEEKRRISLSLKEAMIKRRMAEQEDGQKAVHLDVGQVLSGIVEDHKPYGIFVRLPQIGLDVRGLLPMEEIADADKVDVKKRFPRGKEIRVEIIDLDKKGKIRLSQKVMKEREEREGYQKFVQKEGKSGSLGTLGDIFKNLK